MAVIAITIEQIVFAFLEDFGDADGDGFLAAVEMAEPADALAGLGVFLVGAFFEASDEHHHPEAFALLVAGDRRGYFNSRSDIDFVNNGHVVALQFSALRRLGAISEKFSWIHVSLQWLTFKSVPLGVVVEL